MQSSQNSGVAKKKDAERIEFVKFPNSTTFASLKINFKTEVCSVSSFPTEKMVWITEFDSAKGRDEIKSCSSKFG